MPLAFESHHVGALHKHCPCECCKRKTECRKMEPTIIKQQGEVLRAVDKASSLSPVILRKSRARSRSPTSPTSFKKSGTVEAQMTSRSPGIRFARPRGMNSPSPDLQKRGTQQLAPLRLTPGSLQQSPPPPQQSPNSRGTPSPNNFTDFIGATRPRSRNQRPITRGTNGSFPDEDYEDWDRELDKEVRAQGSQMLMDLQMDLEDTHDQLEQVEQARRAHKEAGRQRAASIVEARQVLQDLKLEHEAKEAAEREELIALNTRVVKEENPGEETGEVDVDDSPNDEQLPSIPMDPQKTHSVVSKTTAEKGKERQERSQSKRAQDLLQVTQLSNSLDSKGKVVKGRRGSANKTNLMQFPFIVAKTQVRLKRARKNLVKKKEQEISDKERLALEAEKLAEEERGRIAAKFPLFPMALRRTLKKVREKRSIKETGPPVSLVTMKSVKFPIFPLAFRKFKIAGDKARERVKFKEITRGNPSAADHARVNSSFHDDDNFELRQKKQTLMIRSPYRFGTQRRGSIYVAKAADPSRYIVCLMGMPGTGKTTLAEAIAQKCGFQYIDLHSLMIQYAKSDQGVAFLNRLQTKGLEMDEEAKDEELCLLIKNVIYTTDKDLGSRQHYLIEGFPLTGSQARLFNTMIGISKVIELECSSSTICMQRLLQEVYDVYDGGQLDGQESVVNDRMEDRVTMWEKQSVGIRRLAEQGDLYLNLNADNYAKLRSQAVEVLKALVQYGYCWQP